MMQKQLALKATLLMVTLTAVLVSCGGRRRSSECEPGGEGCACIDAQICDPGLICQSGVCESVGSDGDGAGANTGQAGGSGTTGRAGGSGTGTAGDEGPGTESTCGNGMIDDNEQCDGRNLDGESCESLGEGRGTLGCDSETCLFDVSMCSGFASGGYGG